MGDTEVVKIVDKLQKIRYERAPLHVVKARYTGGYCVWLTFSDARKGVS